MRWLIAEDALRDRKGHWFEYLGTFARELRALGDDVTILADSAAEPFLVEQLQARPVLPASIWFFYHSLQRNCLAAGWPQSKDGSGLPTMGVCVHAVRAGCRLIKQRQSLKISAL